MSTKSFSFRADTDDGKITIKAVAIRSNATLRRVVLSFESAVYTSVLVSPRDALKIAENLTAAAATVSETPPPPPTKPVKAGNGRAAR